MLESIFLTILLPVIIFIVNLYFRAQIGPVYSAGADLLLAIIVFDVGILMAGTEIQPLITSELIKQETPVIFSTLLLLGILCWVFCIFSVEKRLVSLALRHNDEKTMSFSSFLWLSAGVMISLIIVSIHMSIFLWS